MQSYEVPHGVCCKSLQMGQNSHTITYHKPIAISEILFSDFFLLLRARLGLLFVENSEKHSYIYREKFFCKAMYRTLLEGVWLSDIGRMAEVRNVPHLACKV